MVRVQIYLTEDEKSHLQAISRETHQSQSELIRLAIDQFIAGVAMDQANKTKSFDAAAGMWKDRVDVPDIRALRVGFNRSETGKGK